MSRMTTPLLALAMLVFAGAADARTVWKGRDGKAYDSVKDCFTNNPQCLPETVKASVSGTPSTGSPREAVIAPASARRAGPTLPSPVVCMGPDRWSHPEPCDAKAGELRVQILDLP